jgi:aminobenzoyl-glutamate utilization protein B
MAAMTDRVSGGETRYTFFWTHRMIQRVQQSLFVIAWLCVAPDLVAQAPRSVATGKAMVARFLDANASHYGDIAQTIWDHAEVGYQEERSSVLLQQTLREAGFTVEAGVAGIPTAFVATFSTGAGPVLGILAEFDALPGITQGRSAERQPIGDKPAGHACGHHLFGAASTAAAISVKEWMTATRQRGTIRVYGTPAEEGGAGKVYMVRDGLFKDVDVVLHWHPGDRNSADAATSLANKSAKFRFRGISAHAAGAPDRGRSALDGVEAMNHMVNLMREHVPSEARIHYVITAGGSAPNVVPDFAEVFYYVRHPNPRVVQEMFDRVVKASEGAAMGTGTTVDHEVIHGIYNLLPNVALQRVMHANLTAIGGQTYSETERAFAEIIRGSFGVEPPPLSLATAVQPFRVVEDNPGGGSTDVADVSWVVPTVGMRAATWVPGTSSHSWQAIAAGGMSIGNKGMVIAAKSLAATMVDLFVQPEFITAAKAEYRERVGPNFTYRALVGDRPPPLDYRKAAGSGGQ